MPLIDDASVLTQLSTLISSVTPSTEGTERLVFLLKTSNNASVPYSSIINELLSRIDNITTSSSIEELNLLVKAVQLIEPDRILTVPDVITLNTYTNATVGTVLYVLDQRVPYIRTSANTWTIVDPTLQPRGTIPNMFGWGGNVRGTLGDNTTTSKSSPVSVLGGISDWIQVSTNGELAGDGHVLAIRANGTAWGLGGNGQGRLGDNSATARSSPVSVVGGITDWTQVSAGGSHSLGVRANGLLYAWGYGNYGRLGHNLVTNASSPIQPVGGILNWTQASAGARHSLGLRATGQLYSWGLASLGRLGDNSTVNKSSPVLVAGGFVDWTQASAGNNHSLGLRATGQLYSWGANNYGSLGHNTATTASVSSPVLVAGGFVDWTQASAGDRHNVALRGNGTLYAWGYNNIGQIGNGSSGSGVSSPVLVVGGFTDWIQASAGSSGSLGLRANGTLWSWGSGSAGRIGDGTTVAKNSPVSVTGGFSDWLQASCGYQHSTALRIG